MAAFALLAGLGNPDLAPRWLRELPLAFNAHLWFYLGLAGLLYAARSLDSHWSGRPAGAAGNEA